MMLAEIVRRFGVEPDAIRLIRRRYNAHWLVHAGERRYVLRRFGTWRGEAEDHWEVELVRRLAEAGVPVAAPIGPPRRVDGALHILMPFLPGRPLGAGRRLGGLARCHGELDLAPARMRQRDTHRLSRLVLRQ